MWITNFRFNIQNLLPGKKYPYEAISVHGTPEIINSDQGSQFTSDIYTDCLKSHEIRISMDGRGRAIDNIFIERL